MSIGLQGTNNAASHDGRLSDSRSHTNKDFCPFHAPGSRPARIDLPKVGARKQTFRLAI
jgi:hypothetical protein